VATMLLYLSDVEEGGETAFFSPDFDDVESNGTCDRKADLLVKPVKGSALLFYSIDPSGGIVSMALMVVGLQGVWAELVGILHVHVWCRFEGNQRAGTTFPRSS